MINVGNLNQADMDASLSRERLELETRVLAAALRQSLEIGDTVGSNLAHEQIFLLIKRSQDLDSQVPVNFPRELHVERKRQMPDIDWGSDDETVSEEPASNHEIEQVAFEVEPSFGDAQPLQPEALQQFMQIWNNPETTEVFNFGAAQEDEARETALDVEPFVVPEADEEDFVSGLQLSELSQPKSDVQQEQELAPEPEPEVEVEVESEPEAEPEPEAAPEPKTEIAPEPARSNFQQDIAAKLAAMQTSFAPPQSDVHDASAAVQPKVGASVEQDQLAKQASVGPMDLYAILGVDEKADAASIERTFLSRVKAFLRTPVILTGQDRKADYKKLQSLWIARDILFDPVTRTDFDFRRLGLRSDEDTSTRDHLNKSKIRIGELLLCAGLLEETELEIAADMHRAMPEMLFGAFLVKQEFIQDADLDCVLLGQQLIRDGLLSTAQFKEVMEARKDNGMEMSDILLQGDFVSQDQLQEAYRAQSEDTLVKVPVVPISRLRISATTPSKDAESVPAPDVVPAIDLNKAVPSWKDQLDWSMDEQEQEQEPEPEKIELAPEPELDPEQESITEQELEPSLDPESEIEADFVDQMAQLDAAVQAVQEADDDLIFDDTLLSERKRETDKSDRSEKIDKSERSQSNSDSWSIVSLPASAMAHLLMDDELPPDTPANFAEQAGADEPKIDSNIDPRIDSNNNESNDFSNQQAASKTSDQAASGKREKVRNKKAKKKR